jgi:hypothetical protein
MIESGYASGGQPLPRVVTLSVSAQAPTASGRRFGVRWHEEATPVCWTRTVNVSDRKLAALDASLGELDAWSRTDQDDPGQVGHVRRAAERVGRWLHDTFVGEHGLAFLADHPPTALMLDADEYLLHLPWELMADSQGPLGQRYPFGRLVTTRTRPRPERDPTQEDDTIRVLAVVDPTRDFGDAKQELDAIRTLADVGALEVDILDGEDATHDALAEHLAAIRYDVLHVSCHGGFSRRSAGHSGLLLADGPLLTSEIAALPFAAPPYVVFMSACWSTRSAAGRRLTTTRNGSTSGNGVAATFLAAGASACAGYGWPVTVTGAAAVTDAFYRAVVGSRNIGLAVLRARNDVAALWRDRADLAPLAFTFYGDVGTAQRAEGANASNPDPPHVTRRDIATAS